MDGLCVSHQVIVHRGTGDNTANLDGPLHVRGRSKGPTSVLTNKTNKASTALPNSSNEEDLAAKKRTPKKRITRRSVHKSTLLGIRSFHHNLEQNSRRISPHLSELIESGQAERSVQVITAQYVPSRRTESTDEIKPRRLSEGHYGDRHAPRPQVKPPHDRRVDSLRTNASSISVLSARTASSDRSSETSSTITQRSYNKRARQSMRCMDAEGAPCNGTGQTQDGTDETSAEVVNVFDYMQQPSVGDEADAESTSSSLRASNNHSSDAGSSEFPASPSSRSTFPSPVVTGDDWQGNKPMIPESEPHTEYVQASSVEPRSESPAGFEGRISACVQHFTSPQACSEQQDRDDSLSYSTTVNQDYHENPAWRQSGLASIFHDQTGSTHLPEKIAWRPHQLPPLPAPSPYYLWPQSTNRHVSAVKEKTAHAPPTPSHSVIAGREEVALGLSNPNSKVKPVFRRFEYLNLRVLLQLQSELSEMEDELRALDDHIAQLGSASRTEKTLSPSRNPRPFYENDSRNRRTHLLWRISAKTNEYNRAMASHAVVTEEAIPADQDSIKLYKSWLMAHSAIGEVEAHSLDHVEDLILLGKATKTNTAGDYKVPAYFVAMVILPTVLYEVIPALIPRLAITAVVAIAGHAFASSAGTRELTVRQWIAYGASISLLAALLAVHGRTARAHSS